MWTTRCFRLIEQKRVEKQKRMRKIDRRNQRSTIMLSLFFRLNILITYWRLAPTHYYYYIKKKDLGRRLLGALSCCEQRWVVQ